MTQTRFALPPVGLWTGALDCVPATRARELAAELEELGYGALWVPEVAGRDPFVQLALLLSATERLIGATGIANIWARDAVATSCATNALTEAFPERVLIGLGVSHANLVGGLRGHTYDKPLTAMREYLDGIDAAPYTAERPTTPVRYVLAALRPKMLGLAGERTAGAHPYFTTPEHTARARETLGAGPLLCPEQAVLLETDPAKARAIGRVYTTVYLNQPNYVNNIRTLGFAEEDLADGGSDAFVDALVAWGDEDTVRARVQAHLDAGADHVAVQALPTTKRGVPADQWRALAAPLAHLTR
ncbi:LLM class F420-dependent oxidoreductase [Pseudonocardia oroxyli]|uniref:Probable F420-dependent oxidoreductase, MSMEG_4141 family n=1 Tax=Pseudonocardia oroxyli TaxID=366584 RepID=A0A1G7DWP1_PSEOR|nr:LLM class F420-dependent oxidoreductase [Pseudonocardia oroxyli]SDE55606.1 probable F420-dependent oxidoreductase, MSMEG_4141 family [Pseudonocardia oroxyli]